MNLLFTFPDNSYIESAFILEGAKLTECFYNDLKSADNSASVRIPFNESLCDKIKANISKNIKIQIKDGNTNLFTGYARKTVAFSKTQRNQPFGIEIVSPAILLDYTYNGTTIHYSNTTLGNVVTALLSLSPFGFNIDVTPIESKQLLFFKLEDGTNIKNVLNELLFEYGYCYDFDSDGNFYITDLFPVIPTTPTQKFNGDNCLNEINQTVKEDKYNRVSVEWNKIQQQSNVLIFEDTTGADSNNKANIKIESNSYYLDEENNYLEYDSKFQSIAWIDSASLKISFDDESSITKTFSNLGERAELSIYNGGNAAKTITGLQVFGTGYFEISTNFAKAGQNGTENTIKAVYIQNDEDASKLAKKLCDYYNYSNFTTSVLSKTKYAIGTYVELSDSGIGTVIYRIVRRTYDFYKKVYTYSLESVSEYSPVETYTNGQNVKSKGDNGETLRDAVSDLNRKVDGIVTSATMVSADILSAIIKLDNDGKTIAAQDITTTISMKQSDIDLDFTVGTINLPSGWTYTISGNKIIFHIAEGISLRSGQFSIPVLYKPVVSEEFFIDENGDMFVDENNIPFVDQVLSGSYTQWNLYFTYFGDNGGVYLGLIRTLSGIPSQNNYGDYFTWGGADTVSPLAYEGKFLTARVYKYVGEGKSYKWQQDTNAEHGQAALSDVLDVANADLQKNNSTVYQFLDHLTANTIYADMIVANDAFINKITAKVVSIGNLATVGTVEQAKIDAETNAMNNVLQDLGVDTLSNHTIISGGKIKTDLINASVIAVGDLKDGSSLVSTVNSKADESSFVSYQNEVDNKFGIIDDEFENTNTAIHDLYLNQDNIIDSTIPIEIKNAKVNGSTLIQGGYIRTNLLDVETILGINATFKGTVEAARFVLTGYKEGDVVVKQIASPFAENNSKKTISIFPFGSGTLKIKLPYTVTGDSYSSPAYITCNKAETLIINTNTMGVYEKVITVNEGDEIKITVDCFGVGGVSGSFAVSCSALYICMSLPNSMFQGLSQIAVTDYQFNGSR